MRLGCLLPLISIGLLIGVGQGVYTYLGNRKAVEISISDFIKQPPSGKWLKVTGGQLDTLNAVYTSGRTKGGDAKEIYLPVVPPGSDSSKDTIHLLLLTKDPELVQFINDSRKFDETEATEEQAAAFLAANTARFRPLRDVEGLVQFGIASDGKKEDKMRKLYGNLASDAVILEDGKKPSAGQGFGMLAAGLLLAGFLARRSTRKTPDPVGPKPLV